MLRCDHVFGISALYILIVMLCYVMLCYVTLRYVTLRYVILCYVMLCYVMLCYVMLCYVMLCYVMLCYVMLCYVMLCYVTVCASALYVLMLLFYPTSRLLLITNHRNELAVLSCFVPCIRLSDSFFLSFFMCVSVLFWVQNTVGFHQEITELFDKH